MTMNRQQAPLLDRILTRPAVDYSATHFVPDDGINIWPELDVWTQVRVPRPRDGTDVADLIPFGSSVDLVFVVRAGERPWRPGIDRLLYDGRTYSCLGVAGLLTRDRYLRIYAVASDRQQSFKGRPG